MMTAGEKRKALKAEALVLFRLAKAAMRLSKTLPKASHKAREIESMQMS
jgi:hypothetical protein